MQPVRAMRTAWMLLITGLAWVFPAMAAFDAIPPSSKRVCEKLLANYASVIREISVVGSGLGDGILEIPKKDWATVGFKSVRKLQLIGKGGMARVYRVEVEMFDEKLEKTTRKTMAWREVAPEKNIEYSLRVEREGYYLQNMAFQAVQVKTGAPSLHIVPIWSRIHFHGGDGEPVADGYLMELTGPSLQQLIQEGGEFSLHNVSGPVEAISKRIDQIELIVKQFSAALAELAHSNTVHYDLTPSNVVIFGGIMNDLEDLLSGVARLGLLDFGFAVPEGVALSLGSTRGYTAPEKIPVEWESVKPAEAADDLYSLNLIVAEMLGGVARQRRAADSCKPGVVMDRFAEQRQRFVELALPLQRLKSFNEMSDLSIKGLIKDGQRRLEEVKKLDSRFLQISDRRVILGPKR